MRNLTLLLTLCLLLCCVSPSCGDWFYDFDDGTIPDSFTVRGVDESFEMHTDTMQASADGGVLRMWDTLSPANGGTAGSDAFHGEVFHGNLRVSAEINAAGTSNDWIGVNAGATEPFVEDTSFYWAAINFDQNNSNYGLLHVAKGLGNANESVSSSWRIPDANRSYFIELDVINDATTGFPEVSSRLFDHEGGTLLTEVSMTDTNIGGVPPATTGRAGAVAWTSGSDLFDATFDNIRAESLPIPEPSTLLLALISLGMVGISLIPRGHMLD